MKKRKTHRVFLLFIGSSIFIGSFIFALENRLILIFTIYFILILIHLDINLFFETQLTNQLNQLLMALLFVNHYYQFLNYSFQ